ncbi:fam-h protein [Plasmodium relictum]|uniref:Fam-h protein n=1 Tax=Plasmodium relictum TaxID=85471 RepID=A0A1J1GK44_PLARL|nr:fam-h protein [Plasmodium relictum]CRG84692.1 fam-h protein [Plasmodium relictum]
MNRKSNTIKNINVYPRHYSHISKDFITTDMSTIKIYHKKEKKYALDFVTKFFIFALLTWMLQCSNNCNICATWNYENNLKSILNLGAKRLLTESNDTIKQKKGLQCYEQHGMMTINLEPSDEQNEIEQNINVEQENEIETKEKYKKVKFNERISDKCVNNFKTISLILAFLMSFISFVLSPLLIKYYIKGLRSSIFILCNLSSIIFLIFLIYEEIKIKRKNK